MGQEVNAETTSRAEHAFSWASDSYKLVDMSEFEREKARQREQLSYAVHKVIGERGLVCMISTQGHWRARASLHVVAKVITSSPSARL